MGMDEIRWNLRLFARNFDPRQVPRGLVVSTLAHCLFGQVWMMQFISFNPLAPVLQPFVKASFYAHYGRVLSPESFAWLWSTGVVSMNIGAVIASLTVTKPLLERWGRRDTLLLWAQALFTIGCLMEVLSYPANAFELLFFGRFLTGFGIFSGSFPIYVTECAPDRLRGKVWTLVNLGQYAYIILAAPLALPQLLGQPHLWPVYFLLMAVPSLLYASFVFILPRSPKWLYITKNKLEEATAAIMYYHGEDADTAAIIGEYEREAQLQVGQSHQIVNLKTIWNDLTLRYPMLLSMAAAVAMAFSGEQIYGAYSTTLFLKIGLTRVTVMLVIAASIVAKLVAGSLVSLFLIERIGRRPLLLAAEAFACVGLVFWTLSMIGLPVIASDVLAFMGYGIGLTGDVFGLLSIPLLLVSELNPTSSRSQVTRLFQLFYQTSNMLQIFLFPPLMEYIGGYAFLPVLVAQAFAMFFLWRFLPETRSMPVDTIVRRRAETITGHLIDWTKGATKPPSQARRGLAKTTSLGAHHERTPLLADEHPANRDRAITTAVMSRRPRPGSLDHDSGGDSGTGTTKAEAFGLSGLTAAQRQRLAHRRLQRAAVLSEEDERLPAYPWDEGEPGAESE